MGTLNFKDAIKVLPQNIQFLLSHMDVKTKNETFEIRLRKNKPLILFGKYGSIFVKTDNTYSSVSPQGAVTVTAEDITDTVAAVCNYSVYSRQNDMMNGFLTYGNGHRVGISGEAVTDAGNISMIKNISSISIRIASESVPLPDKIVGILTDFNGIVIAGKPCSGKTTILKSLAEKLSSDYLYGFKKIAVIDERFELGNLNSVNCDILSGYPKLDGIIHAVRTLSPEVIICDEISSCDEAYKITEGMYSGVKFIVSIHASTTEQLLKRPVSEILLNSGCFDKFVLLDSGNVPGIIKGIYNKEELYYDNNCSSCDNHVFICNSLHADTKREYSLSGIV